MKKLIVIIMTCVLLLGTIAGCNSGSKQSSAPASPASKQSASPAPAQSSAPAPASQSAASPADNFPNKPINVSVAFAPGGGNDVGMRILAQFAEKELGVPIVIENKAGGGGWIAWAELLNKKPDGYNLSYIVSPNFITGYMNPTAKRAENLDSFDYIMNHVDDAMTVAVRTDDKRFNDIKQFVEYGQKNELVAPSLGVAGTVHIAGVKMNQDLGTKMRFVQFAGASEALTACLGGNVDMFLGKVSEVMEPRKNGQLRVLAVMMPERVQQLSDVPTLKEVFGKEIVTYSVRGLVAPKGVDPKILAKLSDAFEKAANNPEHVKKMTDMGVKLSIHKGDAFKKRLQEEEKMLIGLKSMFGW